MPNYSVTAEQLNEGAIVFVEGSLVYARVTRVIEGAELAASDARKAQNGMNPVGRPHTTATIANAVVRCADPAKPTLEETFVAERCYSSAKHPEHGVTYSIDSKGTNLPVIAIPSASGDGTYDQDLSGQELASGVKVTLVLRVYKPKNYAKRGLALEQVVVRETPRYFNAGGVATNELAARGIVFNTPPRAMQSPAGGSAVGGAEGPVGTVEQNGLSFPAPQPMVAPAVAAQPVQVQVAQPVPVAAPPVETIEQKIARLEAENAAMKNADSGSPFMNPWATDAAQPAGIVYQG